MKINIPHLYSLLKDLPEEEHPVGDELVSFWKYVAFELNQLLRYASQAQNPDVVLTEGRKAGSQFVWEFWVNDLALPREDHYNWHGHNTSQWLYAGAIVVTDRRVSSHH